MFLQLQEITSLVNIISFGRTEVKYAASIRVNLEQQGTPIGPYDILIAASALANNLTLVTDNTSEFKRVSGLKIEDW
ncbi:VapC toxin protein [Olavius algarvensis Delta 1 endosymbiont]|nr:VapC toxin protein [Olavius algarvensis Delta 1 endosymbiont]